MKAAKPSDSLTASRDVNRIWRVKGASREESGQVVSESGGNSGQQHNRKA